MNILKSFVIFGLSLCNLVIMIRLTRLEKDLIDLKHFVANELLNILSKDSEGNT